MEIKTKDYEVTTISDVEHFNLQKSERKGLFVSFHKVRNMKSKTKILKVDDERKQIKVKTLTFKCGETEHKINFFLY